MKRFGVAGVMTGAILLAFVLVGQADAPPTQEQIEFAQGAMNRLQSELFAALLNEFAATTPENHRQGILAIGIIFDDRNKGIRLVGELAPLGGSNAAPKDSFEEQSLALAMTGHGNEGVEKVSGKWYVRRSVPLSNFHPSCVICHSNFGSTPNPNEWTGALMLQVPVDPTNTPINK